jgi:protein-disulfide isomerase
MPAIRSVLAPVAASALAALAALAAPGAPAGAQGLTEADVKRLALEAILENPEVLMEAVEILRQRQEEQAAAAQAAAIAELRPLLENDPDAPVLGNPEGDVTVVEFFDYNCPYCKEAAADLRALLAGDPGIRMVMREFPILGEGSVVAAKAALAARAQGLYEPLHWALMAHRGRKDEAAVMRIAAEVGLDLDRLRADMESAEVAEHLRTSRELAEAAGFNGTPAFVIGGEGVPGRIPLTEMQALVATARAAGSAAEPQPVIVE